MPNLGFNRPLLSILIPTRNRSQYLYFAIQSALNIKSSNIEIIVSENYSQDDSLEVCNSFSDARLQIVSPPKPLPMHENWEFLLNLSTGKWVTFIGDDDAVMPHCLDHLSWIDINFPQAEALFSPRAYYFWDGCQKEYGDSAVAFSFSNDHFWVDSKKQLDSALKGEINYIDLPQMYSGGFHRRSLINRVLETQRGIYFKSVTPDAYTALMACLHTYRYLQTNVPMTWVGSSPHKALNLDRVVTKDRQADFWGMLGEDSLIIHSALGDLSVGTFTLYLYEAYISAFPLTSPELLSMKKVESVFNVSVRELRKQGREEVVLKLSQDLGFDVPLVSEENIYLKKLLSIVSRARSRFSRIIRFFIERNSPQKREIAYQSSSHQKHPNILSCDDILIEAYSQCTKNHTY